MKGNVMTNANFEKYQFLVEQELTRYKELIASKEFLSGAFSLEGYEITHSQKEAYDLYTVEEPPAPYFSYPDLIGEVVPSNFTPFYDVEEIDEKIDNLWDSIFDNLWKYVYKEMKNLDLYRKELEDIDGFIYNDFLSIIAYKSFVEIVEIDDKEIDDKEIDENDKMFLEKQIEVYKNGGFPCGWKGEFPNGVMVVYSPE